MKSRNARICVANRSEAMGDGDWSGVFLMMLSFFILLFGGVCCVQLFGPPTVALGLRERDSQNIVWWWDKEKVVQNGPEERGRAETLCNSTVRPEMD